MTVVMSAIELALEAGTEGTVEIVTLRIRLHEPTLAHDFRR
jgi:hypothetical protein